MKKFLGWKTVLAVLGLVLFASGCKSMEGVPPHQFDTLRQKQAQLKDENDRLEKRIADLHAVIQELNREIAQLDVMRKDVSELKAKRDALMAQVGELRARLEERDKKLEEMRATLEILTGKKWTVFAGGLKVPIQGDILFNSGKANLKRAGKQALQNLQESVNKVLEQHKVGVEYIRIDGHTDTDPIKYSRFDDNWVLGAARANTVRKYLVELGGWKAHKIYISSFAYSIPVDEAKTKEAKAKNRRVEIYIVPLTGK